MISLTPDGRIPFVGRRSELRRLAEARRLLEGHRDRPAHFILLEGRAGIGKTACAEQFLASLQRDETTFVGRGIWNPHLHRHPFAPLLDALDRLYSAGRTGRRLLSFFSHAAYRPLLSLLPLTAEVTGHVDGEPVVPPTPVLTALIAEALVNAARMRPVVLLLDDLHELSDEERNALPLLHAGLRSEPVLLLATVRNDASGYDQIRSAVSPFVAERLSIGPLAAAESVELVARLCGPRIGVTIGGDVAQLAEGVPQRVVEALRVLAERGVLRCDAGGAWEFEGTFDPRLFSPDDLHLFGRLQRADRREWSLLALLACAGGSAAERDLQRWMAVLFVEGGVKDVPGALEVLCGEGVVKRSAVVEGEWTLVHGSLTIAMRERLEEDDCRKIVELIVAEHRSGRSLLHWLENPALCALLLDALPERGTQERETLLRELLWAERFKPSAWEVRLRQTVHDTLLRNRTLLSGRECVLLLASAALLSSLHLRYDASARLMEEAYAISSVDPEAVELHASICTLLAGNRAMLDHTAPVEDLLNEAERALALVVDPHERRQAELNLAKHRTMTAPLDQPELGVLHAERTLRIAEQMGATEEMEPLQSDLLVRSARLRDTARVQAICNELLGRLGSTGQRPSSWMVVQAVRALLGLGEVFAARLLFETWSRETPQQQFDRSAVHSYLVVLLALADGDLEEAVAAAAEGRAEIARLHAGSTTLPWELLGVDVGLKFFTLQSLIAAGRFSEASAIAAGILDSAPATHSRLPEIGQSAQVALDWLRWRRTVRGAACISLVWNPLESSHEEVRDDPTAAGHYRTSWGEREAMPPVRFMAEMLLAELECAEQRFAEAHAAIDRAAAVCERFYSWRNALECRIARVTVTLRMLQHRAARDAGSLAEEIDAILAELAKRGLVGRIEELRALFSSGAEVIEGSTGRNLVDVIERTAAAAAVDAATALRNSRSRDMGPIDRPRLFLMGPIRLMRRHSYLELGEAAFGREGARLLLAALVGAELLDRVPTRDELLDRVAQNPRGGRAQQKALYNAVSAARAVCGSAGAIVAVGPSGMRLNADAMVEGSVWVDVLEMRRAVLEGEECERLGETSRAVDDFGHAVALGRKGEFGADIYADWIDGARDAARGLLRRAVFGLGRIGLRTGLVAGAIEATAMLLLRDPYDEEAYRLVARLHAEEGNRSAALKALATCRAMLLEEFDAEPEEETERLMEELRGRSRERSEIL